jgi:hypothetical protein
VGPSLLSVEISRLHSGTPHSVGLVWTRDRPVAETSTWQHTTLTRDRHPCPQRDSNPQSQQPNDGRPTPYTARPLAPADSWWLGHDIPLRFPKAEFLVYALVPCILSRSTICQPLTKRILRCYLKLVEDMWIVTAFPKGLQLVTITALQWSLIPHT